MSKRHKAKGKSVIQMTQAGLVQKDLSTGETSRLSHRPTEIQFHSSEPSAGQFLHNPGPAQESSKNNRLHIPSPVRTETEAAPSSSQFRQKNFDFPETIDTPASYSPHTSGYGTEHPVHSTRQDFSPSASTAEDNATAPDNPQEYSPYAPEPIQYGRQDPHPSICPPVSSHGRSEQKEHYGSHKTEASFRPAKDWENDFSPHASVSEYRPENSDRQQFNQRDTEASDFQSSVKYTEHFTGKHSDLLKNEQKPFSAVREQGQEGSASLNIDQDSHQTRDTSEHKPLPSSSDRKTPLRSQVNPVFSERESAFKEENPTCFQSEPSSGSDPSRVSPKNNSSLFHNSREHLNTRQPQPDNLPASPKKAKPFHSNNLKESGNKEIITATPHPPVQEQSKPVRHSPQRKGSAPAHNRTSQEAKDNGIDLFHRETPKEIDTSGQQPSSTKGSEKPLKKVQDKTDHLQFQHKEDTLPVPKKKNSQQKRQKISSQKSDKPVKISSTPSTLSVDHPSVSKDNGISLDHRTENPSSPAREQNIAYKKAAKDQLTRQAQKGQDLQAREEQQLHREQEKDCSFDRRSENPLFQKNRTDTDVKESAASSKKKKSAEPQGKSGHSSESKGSSQDKDSKDPKKERKQEQSAKKRKSSKLQFTDEEKPPSKIKSGIKKTAAAAASTAGVYVHRKIHEVERENSAVEGAHKAEIVAERSAVGAYRDYKKGRKYTQRHASQKKKERLQSSSPHSKFFDGTPTSPSQTQSQPKKGLFNKYFQKRRNKKQAVQAAQAAKKSASASGTAAKTGKSTVKKAGSSLKTFAVRHKSVALAVTAIVLLIVLLMTLLQSCSVTMTESLGSITASAWPADDIEIKKADLYYTQLEANLQHKIDTVENRHSDCEEYNYNIGPIEHDQAALVSYLCAKYGSFTFNDEIKQELDRLFQEQYQYTETVKNETRTLTKSVRVGESLGNVVTSGYCSCSICCGQWAGGPTASGAYPQANHTIAVDASDPFVPMGTKVVMNGVEYTVEDTGAFARYGVQFDVYYADHASASAHGHQTWEAYLADDNGNQTVEVTTTETVKVCYVTLSSKTLTGMIAGNLDSDQMERYNIYNSSRGCRQFLGSPFEQNWSGKISSYYGYRTSPTSGEVEMHNGLDIAMPEGTQILAVQDGTVQTATYSSSYGNYIILENNDGYKTLYAHCRNLQVSAGQQVTTGDVIATVGNTGNSTGPHLHIEFSYQGEMYNPYFYLSNGTAPIYGDVPEISGDKAQAIFAEAEKYIGMPYVWGGSSPSSGFDCSGFVSYVYTATGVCNMGRLTAQGIYDICTPISAEQAQPGDLVFFKGTYNTSEVSHVGIYAGNGQMLHCGDPIQYTSINTPYWQSHLFSFGRVGN